jgi:hypothetical protein
MKFKCIKGIADNINVVCLKGDEVEFVFASENEINVIGLSGWCAGCEINFTAKEFADSFSSVE